MTARVPRHELRFIASCFLIPPMFNHVMEVRSSGREIVAAMTHRVSPTVTIACLADNMDNAHVRKGVPALNRFISLLGVGRGLGGWEGAFSQFLASSSWFGNHRDLHHTHETWRAVCSKSVWALSIDATSWQPTAVPFPWFSRKKKKKKKKLSTYLDGIQNPQPLHSRAWTNNKVLLAQSWG